MKTIDAQKGSALFRSAPLLLDRDLVLSDGQPLVSGSTSDRLILVGRREGKRLAATLTQRMEALPRRSVLPIDCRQVHIMDISFGDDAFTRLARGRKDDGRFFVLENVGEELEANLDTLTKIRGFCCPCWLSDRNPSGGAAPANLPTILGDLGQEMRDTYGVAWQRGRITARDLIEEMPGAKLTIAAASNRLNRLADEGVLVALEVEAIEGGGRQKVYAPIG
ncbi:MAG: hypothetical protein SFU56_02245 [Capsulimonadales bacterium]|nr:hypothetical protein [Capsulimonadales bacterium]